VSVTSPVPDPETGIVFTATGRPCFYCGASLADPAVAWSGFDSDVYLHADCVSKLFVRLARDVHEIECPAHYAEIRAALRQCRGGR